MSRRIKLTGVDDHPFSAWRADPDTKAKGGIVVLHAVYGLTDHMGDVCQQYADNGYAAIAPALYDRIKSDIVHPTLRMVWRLAGNRIPPLDEKEFWPMSKRAQKRFVHWVAWRSRASVLAALGLGKQLVRSVSTLLSTSTAAMSLLDSTLDLIVQP